MQTRKPTHQSLNNSLILGSRLNFNFSLLNLQQALDDQVLKEGSILGPLAGSGDLLEGTLLKLLKSK